MEETSGRAREKGFLSQDGQTCNRCRVYKIDQHNKIIVWTVMMTITHWGLYATVMWLNETLSCVCWKVFSKQPFLWRLNISSIIHRRASGGNSVRQEPHPDECVKQAAGSCTLCLSKSSVLLNVGHFHSGPQALMFCFSAYSCRLQMWLFVYSMFLLCFSFHDSWFKCKIRTIFNIISINGVTKLYSH